MDVNKVLDKVNNHREKVEASWIFSLWKDPELYENYLNINEGKDETIKNPDSKFYFDLGKKMYKAGYRTFDEVTVQTFVEGKKTIQKKFEKYGGYSTVAELMRIVDPINVEGYFDKIVKINMLSSLAQQYDKLFENVEAFNGRSSEDVYNAFEFINNSVFLSDAHNEDLENLTIDDAFIQGLKNGDNMGFNYSKFSPKLNYITLGCAPSSLYMVAGHSGTGKSSFVFGNMIMGLHSAGVSTAIISNEMGIDTYKILLLEHVLTNELNYWGLTRKEIKIGKYTPEQESMIRQASDIINDKYADIFFVKMFDNKIDKIIKYLKKLKTRGVQVVLYDTFKSDDSADTGTLWQSLMLDARRLFQACSKEKICCITTYQLALHTTNQRFLDAGCLSNSKQIKEVYETMIYFRPLWDDEYTGEKYDVKPYVVDGKIKRFIELDKNKKYVLLFVDKTRADEDKQVLLYEWNPRFNKWKELGYANVINDHGMYSR